MRILLVAYEFPPSPSPQSLRWAYLVRELSLAGHDVHVLTIDLGGSTPGLPALPAGFTIHRTWPGAIRGLVAKRRKRRARDASGAGDDAPGLLRPRAGWKHRVSVLLQGLAERVWFPDLRGEWLRPGRRALDRLLDTVPPDVVISSHEPATTLQLGLRASRRGFPWIADVGDPVLAPYTPPHWRRAAFGLEAAVCARADGILVTAVDAARLLEARHGRTRDVAVMTQGFDDRLPRSETRDAAGDELRLLYTGSFYSFRRPEALIDAVIRTPGARLDIAAIAVPEPVLRACMDLPGQFRLLGFLPHAEVLRLQRHADVLVSIGNPDPSQFPGKVYEYLGACRPILHLHHGDGDDVARLLARTRRGESCADDAGAIAAQLARLLASKRRQGLDEAFDLSVEAVAEHGWSRIGHRLDAMLARIVAR